MSAICDIEQLANCEKSK